jgi:uncharacterized protein
MTTLKFNVAQLLREMIGTRRSYEFREETLPLDETLVLRDIVGRVQFARTKTGVLAQIRAKGLIRLVCVRSLEEFDYPVELTIADELHSVIDVITSTALPKPIEEDPFFLDDTHQADVGELLREYTLLELPLNPVCEACGDQLITYSVESTANDLEVEADHPIDRRLEALKSWKNN